MNPGNGRVEMWNTTVLKEMLFESSWIPGISKQGSSSPMSAAHCAVRLRASCNFNYQPYC